MRTGPVGTVVGPPLPPARPRDLSPRSRVSVSVTGGSSVFDMNNFIGRTRYQAGVGARYDLTNNVSVGLGVETAKVRLSRFGEPGRGALDSRRVLANARYTFGQPADRVRPFVQVGVGAAKVAAKFTVDQARSLQSANRTRTHGTDRDVMFDAAIGASVRVAEGVRIEGSVNYQMTDNLRYPIYIQQPGQAERSNYQNNEGKLLRTTGFERHYGARAALVVDFDAIKRFFSR